MDVYSNAFSGSATSRWVLRLRLVLVFPRPPFAEKVMTPHSSTLAWKIPWTEKPGSLQSMGSLGVGHD